MPTPLHTCAAGALVVMLAACQADPAPAAAAISQTAHASTPVPAASESAPQDTARMIVAAGITCPQAAPGPDSTGCSAGLADNGQAYEVELQAGCGDDGFFAAVFQAGGANVVPQLSNQPGAAQASGASLPDKQFVCIQAIAHQGQRAAYYHVRAMDPAQVDACRDDATCAEHRPAADAACTMATPQGCASGWVKADALEVFSNGIGARSADAQQATPVSAQWQVLDSVHSSDGRFQLQVLQQLGNQQAPRRVSLLARQADGRMQELVHNDRLVPCASCGGLAGDPYAYSRFDEHGLDIVTAGGSRERWSSHSRWHPSSDGQRWQLEWLLREVVDTQSEQQAQQKLDQKELGKISLADFDPQDLPPAPVLP